MDIDEFLDRELSELNLSTDRAEKHETSAAFGEDFEPSPLFENIQSNLGKGDIGLAEQSYIQLWHMLLQQKLKWNKELYGQLSALSRQFSSVLNQSYNEVKRKAEHVYELINRARASLREGKKEMPFKIYSEIQDTFNSIPDVFFEEKKIVEEQITAFYRELKNITDNELVKRVSVLVQETNQLIDRINQAIRVNDMISAIVGYNKCIELYNQIPEGFLRHKNSIGMRLLEIYKSLSIYTEISSLQQQLQELPQQKQQLGAFERNQPMDAASKSMLLNTKKESAKKNIEKGFYNEAHRNIQEALQLEPNDTESKAIYAKIKTLQ